MALFKWIFHKSINPNDLKKELKILAKLFQDYLLFFHHKKGVSAMSFPYFGDIHTLKKELERFNEALIKNLSDEKNVEMITAFIESRNVLTTIEKNEIDSIKKVLAGLKEVLQNQLRIFIEISNLARKIDVVQRRDPFGVSPEIPILRNQFNTLSRELKESIDTKEKLLFGENQILTELVHQIIEDREFPIIKSVSCPAIKTAILAKSYLNAFNGGGLGIDYLSSIPKIVSSKVCKTAFYPGSGGDPIIIFCFPNVEIYVLQDIEDWMPHIVKSLEIFARTNIIQNLQNVGNEFSFVFNKQSKRLVVHYGDRGDSRTYVPPEIKSFGIGIIMMKAFSEADEVKEAVLDNILPYTTNGCYINKELIPYNRRDEGIFKRVSKDWFQKR